MWYTGYPVLTKTNAQLKASVRLVGQNSSLPAIILVMQIGGCDLIAKSGTTKFNKLVKVLTRYTEYRYKLRKHQS